LVFNLLLSVCLSQSVLDQFRCNVCKAEFPSKTKLFAHIKEEDHTLADDYASNSSANRGKKKKSKR